MELLFAAVPILVYLVMFLIMILIAGFAGYTILRCLFTKTPLTDCFKCCDNTA